MILLDGYQDENQTKGFFFKSESCNSKNFLIKIETKQINHNCLVTIFELEDIPQANVTVLNIKNGSQICTNNLEYVCEIDLWNKYFLPKFKEESYQWYYDFDKTGKDDEIQGLADVMKFAIKSGLEIAEITLY